MLIFHFHRETGAYCGSNLAEPDPLELEQARQAVYQPLFEAAAQARVDAVAAAISDFDQVAGDGEASAEEIAAAAGIRDLAIEAAGQREAEALQAAFETASQVEPEHWLVPAFATVAPPPAFDFGEEAVFSDGAWSIIAVEDAQEADPEPDPDPEETAALTRAERTRRISRVRWLVDRHRDELDLGRPTTVDAGQYQAVLQHIQDLRDVPEQPAFPAEVEWPELDPALLSLPA